MRHKVNFPCLPRLGRELHKWATTNHNFLTIRLMYLHMHELTWFKNVKRKMLQLYFNYSNIKNIKVIVQKQPVQIKI